jgi:hypothetical protein
MLLGVNKERDMEVNFGTGKEVSSESIADAGVPLEVRWQGGSVIELPIAAEHPPAG